MAPRARGGDDWVRDCSLIGSLSSDEREIGQSQRIADRDEGDDIPDSDENLYILSIALVPSIGRCCGCCCRSRGRSDAV